MSLVLSRLSDVSEHICSLEYKDTSKKHGPLSTHTSTRIGQLASRYATTLPKKVVYFSKVMFLYDKSIFRTAYLVATDRALFFIAKLPRKVIFSCEREKRGGRRRRTAADIVAARPRAAARI